MTVEPAEPIGLSEHQRDAWHLARDFAQNEIAPHAREWNRDHHVPVEVFRKLGELGLLGLTIPERYGGPGLDATSLALVTEELARADAGTSVAVAVQNGLVASPILRAGHPDESGFVVLVSMLRSYGMLVRELETALRPLGITLSRLEVLLLLSFSREERLPTMRLGDLLMIRGSSATYLVDRLEADGLVERPSDPADRRVSIVQLTGTGRARLAEGVRVMAQAGFGPIAGLDDDARRVLAEQLAALRGATAPRIGATAE